MGSAFENLVEKVFGTKCTQRLRQCLHNHDLSERHKEDDRWAKDMILMDVELRETGQREAYLREEVKRLEAQAQQTELSTEEKAQMEKWQAEIEELARQYWHLEREFYRREASCPPGPMLRAYQSGRQRGPDWFLPNKFLRTDCVGRGGCCGRNCGCCERKRFAGGREIRMGHCTVECGCCRRVRGFDLNHEDKTRFKKLFDDADVQVNRSYSNDLKLAYIFGRSK
ncbi:hypothetical protein ATEIFO6365_0003073200 [Aspergillus terreus]|uniref:Uncharacterized protein n=1 Tax=Aspergillus terreus TaxID=33178 RepID=A0A5M3YWK2_ASPTE|nr:hypothetical protein ATETN484_0003067800 [Aspergillus terreus]GFF14664.1 hypothetical protein ATEIFO6365_0003073200 [Aspergillus terreus]